MNTTSRTTDDLLVRCAIGQNIASFAFRDEGRWDALRDLFHPQAASSDFGTKSMNEISLCHTS
jgi:hypothetical protein